MSGTTFQPKRAGETRLLNFDFTSILAVGETLSTEVVTATVYSGVDAAPSAVISGAASASGAVVSQLVTGGTEGVVYNLTCTVTTSLSQALKMHGFLAIYPEAV